MTALDLDDGGEQGPHDAAGEPSDTSTDATATEVADGTAPDASTECAPLTAAALPDAQELTPAPTRTLRRKPKPPPPPAVRSPTAANGPASTAAGSGTHLRAASLDLASHTARAASLVAPHIPVEEQLARVRCLTVSDADLLQAAAAAAAAEPHSSTGPRFSFSRNSSALPSHRLATPTATAAAVTFASATSPTSSIRPPAYYARDSALPPPSDVASHLRAATVATHLAAHIPYEYRRGSLAHYPAPASQAGGAPSGAHGWFRGRRSLRWRVQIASLFSSKQQRRATAAFNLSRAASDTLSSTSAPAAATATVDSSVPSRPRPALPEMWGHPDATAEPAPPTNGLLENAAAVSSSTAALPHRRAVTDLLTATTASSSSTATLPVRTQTVTTHPRVRTLRVAAPASKPAGPRDARSFTVIALGRPPLSRNLTRPLHTSRPVVGPSADSLVTTVDRLAKEVAELRLLAVNPAPRQDLELLECGPPPPPPPPPPRSVSSSATLRLSAEAVEADQILDPMALSHRDIAIGNLAAHLRGVADALDRTGSADLVALDDLLLSLRIAVASGTHVASPAPDFST
ncbi:hypothetical protein HK405_008428, partial [Cladochytrium tenue]